MMNKSIELFGPCCLIVKDPQEGVPQKLAGAVSINDYNTAEVILHNIMNQKQLEG
jgi:hypothetical protein